jgi:mannosyltransferase OCH1-like enzyme
MLIPKIIHQIAPKDETKWHPIWNECHESWKIQFPDFEHKLWNDQEDINNFVEKNYKNFYQLYCAFPYKIMKINFARYCILHSYGGIYADMDVFCYKNFYDIIKEKSLWFNENKFGEFYDSKIYKIENCLIASSLKNKFWEDVLDTCRERFFVLQPWFDKKNISKEWLIVHLTDSDLFEQAKDIYNPNQINFFPALTFNNLTTYNGSELYTKHLRTEKWKEQIMEDGNE